MCLISLTYLTAVFTGPEFKPCLCQKLLFIIVQRISNSCICANKLTNRKSPPSDFCRYVINVGEQDILYSLKGNVRAIFYIVTYCNSMNIKNVPHEISEVQD